MGHFLSRPGNEMPAPIRQLTEIPTK